MKDARNRSAHLYGDLFHQIAKESPPEEVLTRIWDLIHQINSFCGSHLAVSTIVDPKAAVPAKMPQPPEPTLLPVLRDATSPVPRDATSTDKWFSAQELIALFECHANNLPRFIKYGWLITSETSGKTQYALLDDDVLTDIKEDLANYKADPRAYHLARRHRNGGAPPRKNLPFPKRVYNENTLAYGMGISHRAQHPENPSSDGVAPSSKDSENV